MPLNAVEQQKADLAHFREIRYSWKTTSKYPHKRNCLLVVFRGARKRGNRIKSAPSCSIGINGFRRVTRYSRKWAPEVPKNIYNCVGFPHGFLEKWKWGAHNALFCCRFLGILEHPAGILVQNGARARKPFISCRFS